MPENQYQSVPGAQHKLDPQPAVEMVPTPEGGYTKYLAAGKLKGKRALITGGDSGIGQATAVLFAMEGADSFIAHLPQEEKDAQNTKKQVEAKGAKCYLFATDLTKKENCVQTVEKAIEAMGGLDILFNNHAFQMVQQDILSLPDEQWLKTFDTNIHRELPSLSTAILSTDIYYSILLSLQDRNATSSQEPRRRHNHQQRLRQRLHRSARPPRLHLHQGSNRLLHPRSLEPVRQQEDSRQCHCTWSGVDTTDRSDDGQRAAGQLHITNGSTRPAV